MFFPVRDFLHRMGCGEIVVGLSTKKIKGIENETGERKDKRNLGYFV